MDIRVLCREDPGSDEVGVYAGVIAARRGEIQGLKDGRSNVLYVLWEVP
jgi:hypothetical protein